MATDIQESEGLTKKSNRILPSLRVIRKVTSPHHNFHEKYF